MLPVSELDGRPVPDEWYEEIQNFYATHMRHRDSGDVDGWLSAFDEDAEALTNVFAEQAKNGRAALGDAVRELDAKFVRAGLRRRHLLGSFVAVHGPDDTVVTRYYAFVITTKAGEHTVAHSTSVAHDVLVRRGPGEWTVRAREVVRDDLSQTE
jgi:3-phenylpropionate/cinnamic acid dioxygenase small subunit